MGNTTRISYKPNKFSLENLNNNKLTYRFNKSNDDTLLHWFCCSHLRNQLAISPPNFPEERISNHLESIQ